MKLKSISSIFLLTLIIIISMSNRRGRSNTTGRGATTAPGESGQYCGSFGCHFSDVFNTEAELKLLGQDSLPVQDYIPGEDYILALDIKHEGSPAGYGFQVVALNDADNSPVNGFSNLKERMREVIIDDRQYIEQSNTLNTQTIFLDWSAPEQGAGAIRFYAAANAVNGNGNSGGDTADTTNMSVPEAMASSSLSFSSQNRVSFFPNPASDRVFLQNTAGLKQLEIVNSAGMKFKTMKPSNSKSLDISDLEKGVYYLILNFDKKTEVKTLIVN